MPLDCKLQGENLFFVYPQSTGMVPCIQTLPVC